MLAMLLFATIALQLDVGCVDCVEVELDGSGNAELAADVEKFIAKSKDSEGSWISQNNAEFPGWAMPVFGAAMLLVLLLIAGKGLLRKIFIVSDKRKIHGREKGNTSKGDYRDAGLSKRAHRENPKRLRGKAEKKQDYRDTK